MCLQIKRTDPTNNCQYERTDDNFLIGFFLRGLGFQVFEFLDLYTNELSLNLVNHFYDHSAIGILWRCRH